MGVDGSASERVWLWCGCPGASVSEVTIRRVDGSLVRRLPTGSVDDFEAQLGEITRDLRSLDAVPFAQKWIAPPE